MAAKTRARERDDGVKGGGGKKRSKSASQSDGMQMHENMEEDFPRGGEGAYIAPVEVKRLREEAEAEVFGGFGGFGKDTRKSSKGKGKVRKKSKGEDDDEDDFFKSLAPSKLPKFVELLKFKAVATGMKLLGIIAEVKATELVVSLPHGLTGRVLLENASGTIDVKSSGRAFHLDAYFSPGQYVRCCVVNVWGKGDDGSKSKKKTIDLSLKVDAVNAGLRRDAVFEGAQLVGCVKSVEDHGYLVDFGIKGASGFLPKKHAESSLKKGCLVDVVVKSVGTGREKTAQLTALKAEVAAAMTQTWTGVDINSLIPGMLVNANVRNVLSDGLLVSFLTFFTGTIDPFHLDRPLSKYKAGQKAKARVLYCDPMGKQLALSLLPHLVRWEAPMLPSKGDVYEKATVQRVDSGLGLAIGLPIDPSKNTKVSSESDARKDGEDVYRSYAHISNISDTQKIDDLDKRFKQGQVVKCRVVGFRQVDGLANVSLKPTVVDGSMLDISELRAGVKVSGVVDSIDESVMTVKLSPHLKALVPALHLSDATHKKAYKKFKVGQTVSGTVLEVQSDKRKIIMTMKKSLIDSKYPIIGSLADIAAGMKSHGVVTGIRDDGIFVTFYNNMSGMIGESQLGLKSSQSPHDAFSVGQVVKVRVLGANMKTKKLRLTLLTKQQAADVAARNDKLGGLAVGETVRGVVKQVLRRVSNESDHQDAQNAEENDGIDEEQEVTGYMVQLEIPGKNSSTEAFGRLDVGHLADHPSACSALAETLVVGSVLDDLVVLEKLETIQQVRLTNKDSIRQHVLAGEMPLRLEDVRVGSVLPGFVASVAGDAVYVRFMDHLTGRARLQQLADTPVADPAAVFQMNMSVRACISQVDLEKGQISVSLKESVCSETSGMYVRSLFQDLELAGRLDTDTSVDWESAFRPFGSKVDVTVHGIKEYGILCDFKKYPDVVGLIAEGQFTSSQSKKLKEGSRVTATILDVSRKDGIVDLSALDDVQSTLKRKSKGVDSVAEGETVEVTVLQVKNDDGYAIVALPEKKIPAVGFVCLADFNPNSHIECSIGQKLKARVVAMPSAKTGDRLVLVPADLHRAVKGNAKGSARTTGGARKELPDRGAEVEIKVDAVHTLHADVTLQKDGEAIASGKLHISQIAPWSASSKASKKKSTSTSVMSTIMPGSVHKAYVIGLTDLKGKKSPTVHVSLQRPGETPPVEWKAINVGEILTGYVQGVNNENIWITFSPFVKGRCFIPDCSATLEDCANAPSKYTVGTPVRAKVMSINQEKHAMDVMLLENGEEEVERSFAAGTLACGYVTGTSGSGVAVKLAWDTVGRVNLTDIYSVAVKNALVPVEKLKGTFVKVSVISTKATKTNPSISLSLRASSGAVSTLDESKCETLPSALVPKPSIKLAELSPGTAVSGYVKVAGKMGVFITLGRDLEARIKLRQLQDEFVEDPLSAYPPGTYVQGRVVTINNGKIDVSLRTRKTNANVDGYHEGQIIKGTVKRIEKFGVFVSIADSSLTGMAHVSELCDGFVQDIGKLFKVGQEVQARVVKVDKENGKLSLGLKPSYFELGDEDDDMDATGQVQAGEDSEDDLDQALLATHNDESGSSDDYDDAEEDDDDDSEDMDLDEMLVG